MLAPVLAALFALPLAADGAPVTSAPAQPKPEQQKPEHLKVLVLDVQSAELTASERVTLANLEAAHLSEEPRLDVLSGEDVKQLVALSGQAAEIGVSGNCTDACMAELAGALGAGVVVSTQAGKLGDTLVVTLAVFDAAKARSVSRKSITASSLGELPGKLGPALDDLVKPLLPQLATALHPPAQTTTTTSTTTASALPAAGTGAGLTGRMRELFEAEHVQICVDPKDKTSWWFCDARQGYTENAFVRKYRALTGNSDVDGAEVNRAGAGSVIAPVALFSLAGAGVVSAGVALGCGLAELCGDDANAFFNATDGPGLPIAAGLGFAAFVGGLTGGIMTVPTEADIEGTPRMHTLSEGEGRAAAARFNDALRAHIERDFTGSGR